MEMRCAVYGCNNNNKSDKSLRFYCFPKEPILLKQWQHFCKRKDYINPKYARICLHHFTSDDFVRNLQFEMGLCKQNGFKLKPGTVPSVNPTSNSTVLANERSSRAEARKNKLVVESLLKKYEVPEKIVHNESIEFNEAFEIILGL